MAKAPKWAMDTVDSICPSVTVTWRRSQSAVGSSGRYMTDEHRIVVTAGSSRQDQRLVLLHELAHALTPNHHHDQAFWREAWRLYGDHRLTRYALKREVGYKAAATTVAAKLGIRGAKSAAKIAAARRARSAEPRGKCNMPDDIAVARGYRPGHTHYIGYGHTEIFADGTRAYYHA